MSPQADFIVSNGTGAAVRSDLNVQFAAIVSNNSGATEPATMYAYQWWADTTTGLLKLRNSANSGWVTIRQLDGEFSTVPVENGSAAAPSIYFKDSGTDTGIYSPGADQVAVSTGGTGRLFIDASGRLLVGTSNYASNGIAVFQGNISAPTGAGAVDIRLGTTRPTAADTAIGFLRFMSTSDAGNNYQYASISAASDGASSSDTDIPGRLVFSTTADGASSPTERMRITNDGRVGIGTASPATKTHIDGGSTGTALTVANGGYATMRIGSPANGTALIAVDTGEKLAFGTQSSPGTSYTEYVRIDSSGRFLVGTSTARNSANGVAAGLQVEGLGAEGALSIIRNGGLAYLTLGRSGGASIGSNTAISNNDELGRISWAAADGTDIQSWAAQISAEIDGTPGSNDTPGRLVFSTTADGASSPTERMRIRESGILRVPGIYNSTAATGANVWVASDGDLGRSTSSIKYKTQVENLQDQYADAILGCRPVWYRSTCTADNPEWGWWGFIAEEVAEIDPRLVHWKTKEQVVQDNGSVESRPLETPEPEGVQYERFVPHLLNLIKRQKEQIEAMEARLSALEGE
jgi:hypothetical protein